KLLAELEEEQMKEIEWKTSLQQKEAQLEKERQEIQLLDDSIESIQAKLLEVTQGLEQYEGKKQVFNERHKHLEENKEKLEQQKKKIEMKNHIKRIEEELKIELGQLETLKKNRQETKKKAKELETILSTSKENIMDEIEDLKSIYIEYLNKQAAKRNEKHSIE